MLRGGHVRLLMVCWSEIRFRDRINHRPRRLMRRVNRRLAGDRFRRTKATRTVT